ncbi:MAG: hypothetical protein ACK6EB_02970 [Planctomyces sp.]
MFCLVECDGVEALVTLRPVVSGRDVEGVSAIRVPGGVTPSLFPSLLAPGADADSVVLQALIVATILRAGSRWSGRPQE